MSLAPEKYHKTARKFKLQNQQFLKLYFTHSQHTTKNKAEQLSHVTLEIHEGCQISGNRITVPSPLPAASTLL